MNKQGNINRNYVKTYCASYTNNILDTAFKDSPYLTGNDLRELCNPVQINFNLLRTIFLQWEAEVFKMQNPYFDHEAPAVKNALKVYMEVLSRHIRLDKSSLRPLLQQAVEETVYQVFSPTYFFESLLWPTKLGTIRLSELDKLKRFIRINQSFLEQLINQWEDQNKLEVELPDFRKDIKELASEWDQWEPANDYALSFSKVVAIHSQSLWSKVEQVDHDKPPEVNVSNVNQRFAKEIKSLNDSLQKEQVTLADQLNQQVDKVESLKKGLNLNQRFRFINDLYGGDNNQFNKVIEMIDQCNSYSEAMEILDKNSSQRAEWDMEGEAVKELKKVVSKRFNVPGPAFGERPTSAE